MCPQKQRALNEGEGLPCSLCAWRILAEVEACPGRQMSQGLELGEDFKVAEGLGLEKR